MRLFTSVLASAAIALVATSASANVVFNATASAANPLNALLPGDLVTISIRMTNNATLAPPTRDFVAGVGAAVQGYNPAVMSFVTGEIADTNFFCSNASCTNGLLNGLDPLEPLVEATSAAIGKYVQFVNAVTTAARNGPGTTEPGIDGTNTDAEFRLVFQAGAAGTTTFDIGTSTDLGLGNVIVIATSSAGANSAIVQGVNAQIQVTVIPEPGTALLMGLGLAGLAVAGRRN